MSGLEKSIRLLRAARDSIIPLAAIAAVTKSIKLGTGVLHTWTRNVMTLAMAFATLDELSNGRSMLGIGVLWEPMATMMGISGTNILELCVNMLKLFTRYST